MSHDPRTNHSVIVEDVSKAYYSYKKPVNRLLSMLWPNPRTAVVHWAVKGVSFSIAKGEALGIIGRNGSGKSTILQMLVGTLAPTAGSIRVQGRVAALLELGSGFNPEFTGRENAILNASLLGIPQHVIQRKMDAVILFADIGDYFDRPVKTYSSGMVVRLAFAVQVQAEPDILIVDEALAVGDFLFQKKCYQRIAELRKNGTTLILVSHDLESVRSLTTQAICMRQGQIYAHGRPGDVILKYRELLHQEEFKQTDSGSPPQKTLPDTKPATAEFGDMDARIDSFEVLNAAGQPSEVFEAGEGVVFRVSVGIRKDLANLNIGIRIRNKQGIKMTSWGTLNQDIDVWSGLTSKEIIWTKKFQSDSTIVFDIRGVVRFGEDTYEAQAYVTEEKDQYFGRQRTLHWRDEAAFFKVVVNRKRHFFGGILDAQFSADLISEATNESK